MRIEKDLEGGFIFLEESKIEKDLYVTDDIVLSMNKNGKITTIEYLDPGLNNLSDKFLLQEINKRLQEELELRKEENLQINDGIMEILQAKAELE